MKSISPHPPLKSASAADPAVPSNPNNCVCPGPKGADGRGLLETKENTMKLITRYEAQKLSLEELHGLFREAFNAVAAAPRGSSDRRNALASLKNIEIELAYRGPK